MEPILFDLFDFDLIMIREFIGEEKISNFVNKCFYGILLHEFGVYFVKLICERSNGKRIEKLTDIFEIKDMLYNMFKPIP